LDELQTWCESSSWSATQLISFEGQLQMTFMVSARVKNGVPEGQILNCKAIDEHFPEQ
jgi:hypothetical protein